MSIPHMFKWNWKKSSDITAIKKKKPTKRVNIVNNQRDNIILDMDDTLNTMPNEGTIQHWPLTSNQASNFSLPTINFVPLEEPTQNETFSYLALLTQPSPPKINYQCGRVMVSNNNMWNTDNDTTYCLSDNESKALMERIQFFITPNGGEDTFNIKLSPASPKYNHTRVKEAKTLIERSVVARMNPDSARNVTWRQNLCFTLPFGPISDLFFSQLTQSKPSSVKLTSKYYYMEGKSSKGLKLDTKVYVWDEDNMPSLKSEHWFLKKWNGKNDTFRARCIQFTLTYRPQLDIIRVEFKYTTQKWNNILQAWQDM
ncbi:predicted protein [Naegleria gruberi]|uniref:Predicted protein n=1 Tax=Naegleria gruberi TaxID=5762 RepID=D2W5U5_NAEGR|nr:uncharacterized protein NAEGRDRAFT_76788 [Naegleria gruberi]EFC35555.1 predicted protein [Naegleria gruberi]|eukprot:XP_002668299.1 predicted protein [Naegleria gruberi strain NEG-M]